MNKTLMKEVYSHLVHRGIRLRIEEQGEEDQSLHMDRLRFITLNEKPDEWTGKTWASEQGYLPSTGNSVVYRCRYISN